MAAAGSGPIGPIQLPSRANLALISESFDMAWKTRCGAAVEKAVPGAALESSC